MHFPIKVPPVAMVLPMTPDEVAVDLTLLCPKQVVGVTHLAKLFRVSSSTIRKLAEEGGLPPTLPQLRGNRLRWDAADIAAWVRWGRVPRQRFIDLKQLLGTDPARGSTDTPGPTLLPFVTSGPPDRRSA